MNLDKNLTFFFVLVLVIAFLSFVESQNASVTESTSTQELLSWKAPLVLQTNFPYSLTGHDNDGTPVWLVEYSKWDVRSFLEKNGNKYRDDMLKYLEQMYERMVSPQLFSLDGNIQDTFVTIHNLDGFGMRQLSHRPTVQFFIDSTRILLPIVQRKNFNIKRAYVINSNYVFELMWSLLKPSLGSIAGYVEFYGTNSAKWKPLLLSRIPKNQLPEGLGGLRNFTAVKIYG